MSIVLANVFGIISGTLLAFFVSVILKSMLIDGLPARAALLVAFVLGWALALLVTRPRQSTIAEVLDRGLLLGAIEWGLAFPVTFIMVLVSVSELEMVTSASLFGYVLGGLIIGGGVTLLGVGLFAGFRYTARRVVNRRRKSETPVVAHDADAG